VVVVVARLVGMADRQASGSGRHGGPSGKVIFNQAVVVAKVVEAKNAKGGKGGLKAKKPELRPKPSQHLALRWSVFDGQCVSMIGFKAVQKRKV
jgi:hypothetical protein